MAAITAAVLKHIRENPGVTATKLAKAFHLELARTAGNYNVEPLYLEDVLRTLETAGLVQKAAQGKAASYTVTETLGRIQHALNLSLSDLELRQKSGSMIVTPVFGRPAPVQSSIPSAFIVMPFAKPLARVYDVLKRALVECNLRPIRGDDLYAVTDRTANGGRIMDEIWTAMNAADIVVTDCTGRNPNVMYELGIAHTLGKNVLLLSQSVDDVPFDLRHLRFVVYESTAPGLERLEFEVLKCLRGEVPRAASARS